MSILTVWRWSIAKCWQLKTTMIENEHFNCMKMVSCKVTTIENDDNRKLGSVGVLGAIMGVTGGVGVSEVYWGGKWTGSLTTLGPSPGFQPLLLVPLGEWTTWPTKQVTEMSSADYYIHLELYFVTVLTFVSMPPHIFSHAI